LRLLACQAAEETGLSWPASGTERRRAPGRAILEILSSQGKPLIAIDLVRNIMLDSAEKQSRVTVSGD
jgi:hypothetical protein